MNHWLYPANIKYYDVFGAFNAPAIYWPVYSKVLVGDVIYFYLAVPHKQIAFVCDVVEIDLEQISILKNIRPFFKEDKTGQNKSTPKSFMKLVIRSKIALANNSQLSYEHLKGNGLTGMLMGPRKLENNLKLLEYIKGCLK